jgi:hypothetical protein
MGISLAYNQPRGATRQRTFFKPQTSNTNFMKIQPEQIKGLLKDRVNAAVSELEQQNCKVIAFFFFKDIDHQYSWRSKGAYIAIRYVAPFHAFQQYEDKRIYIKKHK